MVGVQSPQIDRQVPGHRHDRLFSCRCLRWRGRLWPERSSAFSPWIVGLEAHHRHIPPAPRVPGLPRSGHGLAGIRSVPLLCSPDIDQCRKTDGEPVWKRSHEQISRVITTVVNFPNEQEHRLERLLPAPHSER